MATISQWVGGARPKTLPAALVPVAIGTGAAVEHELGWHGGIIWWRALAALVVALALQIGVNYANDYSDGVRGTDDDRAGPTRLVGSSLAPAEQVKFAAFAWFGLAAIVGLTIAVAVGWELIVVGIACIGAAWFYTGGSNPYGYMGLGEVFVFVFFGLVATAGSAYIQPRGLSGVTWLGAVAAGCLATALLITNNLRDIPSDTEANKNTLAVRLGDAKTRWLFIAALLIPFAIMVAVAPLRPWVMLSALATPLAVAAIGPIRGGAAGRDLVPVLEMTGRTQLVFGLLFAVGLWVS